jgi:RimJ/RimL family protein N-acetyltransferase
VTPDITTDRLRINALQPSDAAALFAYWSHERVVRFHSWVPQSVAEAAAFIERSTAIPFNQNDTWYQLAIRSAATGELLGDLGVHFVGADSQQVEIGFTVSPTHQRQGFAIEAVRALLDHLFSVLDKHRVFASVDPVNEASLALLRKLGMRHEAHFRESLFWKGAWVDDVVFGILRSEWLARP